MANIFSPAADGLLRSVLLALLSLFVVGSVAGFVLVRSPAFTGKGLNVSQPVPFSHAHHVGDDGLDCRYCHVSVEQSSFAGLPPTRTCMTCHSQLFREAEMLAPVRESLAKGEPLRWNEVHRLPDYVYFDHSVHVANGVGCTTCHGQVDEMPLMHKAETMTMQWCLSCHRDPAPFLRPPEAVFSATWSPPGNPVERSNEGARLLARYGIEPETLTDCTVCHR